jgi:hypothetical protein
LIANYKKLLSFIGAFMVLLLMIIPGCKKGLTPNEALTLERVRETIIPFIWDHSISHWQFPESYEDMLSKGLEPPMNPYTGKPMIDTGTSEFNPEISPGNIHYVPVKDQVGMIGNFSVYVFGERGVIRHIRPSPLAPE